MSEDVRLSAKQTSIAGILGFCDPNVKACDGSDDGIIQMHGQRDAFTQLDGYRTAFENLASLARESSAIDAVDLDALAYNSIKLAGVISKDPVVGILAERRTALQFGKSELSSTEDGRAIPPRSYRRIMYYIQLALKKLVDPKLKTNGKYDEATRRAVASFRKKIGLETCDGKTLSSGTIGLIAMRCRYEKELMISALEEDRITMQGQQFVFGKARGETYTFVQGRVVNALKWMGYIPENCNIGEYKCYLTASSALQNEFNANLVGPITIGRIIERVKTFKF